MSSRQLGSVTFDALLRYWPKDRRNQTDPRTLETDFRSPGQLLEFIRFGQRRVHDSDQLSYQMIQIGPHVWVRQHRSTQLFHGVPRAESWMIGLTPEIYLRIDIGCTREHDGEAGERWLHSMLSWQNRIIGSLQVTGLRQVLTGHEQVTPWAFPSVLKTPVELPE